MNVWHNVAADWLIAGGYDAPATLDSDVAHMTLTEAADYVIKRFGVHGVTPAQMIDDWKRAVLHQYEHTVPLKAGVRELLQSFAESGTKLAIATSSFPDACEAVLARHGVRQYFSAIVYSTDAGRNKTFPDIYLAAAKALGVPPESCLVFEDLYAALSGVRAGGMDIAAVYDESGKAHWDEFKAQADFAFRRLLV